MRLAFQLAPGRCRRAIPGPTRAHRFFEMVILLLQLVPISATGWCLLAPSKHPSNLQSIQHPITHFWHCNTGVVSPTVLQHQLPTVKQPHTPHRPAMLAMVQYPLKSVPSPAVLQHQLATAEQPHTPHPPAMLAMVHQHLKSVHYA